MNYLFTHDDFNLPNKVKNFREGFTKIVLVVKF